MVTGGGGLALGRGGGGVAIGGRHPLPPPDQDLKLETGPRTEQFKSHLGMGLGSIFKRHHKPALANDADTDVAIHCVYNLKYITPSVSVNLTLETDHTDFVLP